MKHSRIVMVTILLIMTFSGFVQTMGSEENSEISVEVMIDFGGGLVEWAQVNLGTNNTAIKATEDACELLNFDLSATWSSWGVFVYGIGGKASPSDWSWWWQLLIWNNTQHAWESSNLGAYDLLLSDGDVIGWSPNSSRPCATPTAKYPWIGFQHDAHNLGMTKGPGPHTNNVSWNFDTGTKEMASSPVIFSGKVIANNWGGVFCLDEDGRLLWKNAEVIGGFAPAVSGKKVLVGGKDGYLYALNQSNGEFLWKTKISSNPGLSGVTSSPTIVNEKVFVGSFDFKGGTGYLFCLSEEDGNVLWKNSTFSSVYFSSPCVLEDRVYVGTMGLYNSTTLQWAPPYGLFCFDAKSGVLHWNFSVDGSVGSSPTIVNKKIVFSSKDGYLYCLNASDGNLKWKEHIGLSVSSPAIGKDAIYVGSGEMSKSGMFYCFDFDGTKLWEYEPNGAVQSSPAICGDYVYFATNVKNGTVYCLNRSSGQLVWHYRPFPEQFIISSPAIADGKMYIASDNGRLYCFFGETPTLAVNVSASPSTVNVGEDVIFVHANNENKLVITSILGNTVTLKIDSMDVTVEVSIGRTRYVDTDGDGKKDLAITVDKVNSTSQSASILLKAYTEPEDEDSNMVFYIMLIALIVVIVVIIAGIARNFKRRR
ncbi:MAG: PQQ-binding-like beta-propeller repeat protein [Methanomassiliicoccales archaeon]|nr:MAG: PQQ-binding-like beta-propeller repeat protein [Methanomassiliicoccales archaeon]